MYFECILASQYWVLTLDQTKSKLNMGKLLVVEVISKYHNFCKGLQQRCCSYEIIKKLYSLEPCRTPLLIGVSLLTVKMLKLENVMF